jgi:nitrous oxidase accessory protein
MKKRYLVIGIILSLVCMSINPSSAVNNVKESSTNVFDGNILYVGGTGEGNYTRIQDAINDANNGDTVFVYGDSSPYHENVVINKSINLIGENQDTTVIDGNADLIVVSLIEMAFVENAVVSGFTIQNAKMGIGYDTGVNNINMHSFLLNRDYTPSADIYNNTVINNEIGIGAGWWSEGVFLYNNKISNNKKGILLAYCYGDNGIYKNTIVENDYGICLDNSPMNWIQENIISNKNDGITLYRSYLNEITWNIITNNTNGINLSDSEGTRIRDNQIKYNYLGVYFLNSGYSNYIENNVVTENIDGICLENSSWNYIQRNTLKNNQNAISLKSYSKQNKIKSNDIQNNSIKGLLLERSCDKNTIDKNNFIKNNKHAFFINSFKNSWDENYWDNWIGIKINLSIFQKFPKVIISSSIPWINFDWHPAQEPYDI